MRRRELYALLALVLAGCMGLPATPPVTAPVPLRTLSANPPAAETLNAALADWTGDQQRPGAERSVEITRLAALGEPDARSRLRLAHLWHLQPEPEAQARARDLLATLLQAPGPEAAALRPLLTLLQAHWSQEEAQSLQIDQLTQQLRDAQQRADALNAKIQELRAIERNLVSRPAPDGSLPVPKH